MNLLVSVLVLVSAVAPSGAAPSLAAGASEVCRLPPVSETTGASCFAEIPKFTFDNVQNKCVFYLYGGCFGTDNLFDSEEECLQRCPPRMAGGLVPANVCDMTADPGPCFGAFPAFAHNPVENRCEPFTYGGCGGNGNNFESMHDCEQRCPPRFADVCDMPMDPGPCFGDITAFTYNQVRNHCEPFTYGGCAGNGNNFESLYDCQHRCEQLLPSTSQQ